MREILWEEDLPPELRPPRESIPENLDFRVQIMGKCRSDPQFQAIVRELCAVSPYFTVNTFGWTLDPRNRMDPVVPFVQWDCQVRLCRGLIDSVLYGHDFFIEKSRDMGATWNCMTTMTWMWLFIEHSYFLCGSYKEARCDGASGSMLRMIDFYLDKLPPFLLPPHYRMGRNRTYMKLVNPDNGAVIEGEATNPDFGRGERKTAVLFDEFARWGNRQGGMDAEAWEGAADVTATRWALSTPQGTTNHYYMLRQMHRGGILKGDTIWFYEHPERSQGAQSSLETRELTSDWLERERLRRTVQYIQQEVLIKYLGMGSTAFPDQQPWIDEVVRDLIDTLTEDVALYGTPYELLRNTSASVQPGQVIKGMRPWAVPEPGRVIADWMTDPRSHDGTAGILWVFRHPPEDEEWKWRWVIASDQGEGLASGDKSAIHVVDRLDLSVVATWRGAENATHTAEIMHFLAGVYKNAIFAPEGNPVGQACITRLRDIYKFSLTQRILHTETIGKDREERTDRLGFVSTRRTKPMLIESFVKIVSTEAPKINCLQTAIELLNYERTPAGVYQGAHPFHDDMVISYLIALFAADSDQFPDPRKVQLTKPKNRSTFDVPRMGQDKGPSWLYKR